MADKNPEYISGEEKNKDMIKTDRFPGLEERVKKIPALHEKGYTCAQTALCVYSDLLEMDESDLFRISEGFGGGMGGMMLTCGAVTSMAMAAGLKNSCGDPEVCSTKGATIRLVRKLAEEFRKKNGSVICRELKGVETKEVLRECPGCIEDAIRIMGKELFGLEE